MEVKLFFKYDFDTLCKAFIKEHLDALDISYAINSINEVTINENLQKDKQKTLSEALKKYGIEILTDQKATLVERIKHAIDKMLKDEKSKNLKLSAYLSDNLNYSYTYLSSVFSENTYTSIENYTILRKVDLAKEFMCNTDLTLTEIAYRLNYSSVAHLSGQFKKVTGLTPSAFQNIMKKKKDYNLQ
ncbi:AraC family transcriptional regulator [Algibacter sp. 2305UL17-15]|uniref:helix-turn-helix domain-containing protein n=1 Tax=Algibacter sp. 2305UL17-15 TaxID=3231268 RepID=UPI0034591CDD